MSATLTTILALLALLMLGWAIWFVFEFARYILSGEYEVHKRLDRYTRR